LEGRLDPKPRIQRPIQLTVEPCKAHVHSHLKTNEREELPAKVSLRNVRGSGIREGEAAEKRFAKLGSEDRTELMRLFERESSEECWCR
jgi:hypothetical protein